MEYTTPNITPPIAITPEWMDNRYGWSLNTFGKGQRTKGILAHIQCELKEIEAAPNDLMEWVNLLLLAFDGAARAGHSSKAVIAGIHEKHKINLARKWPRRESDEKGPIFHAKQEAIIPDELAEAISHLHEVAYGNVPTVMLAYGNAIANVNKKHVRTVLAALKRVIEETWELSTALEEKSAPMPEEVAEAVALLTRYCEREPHYAMSPFGVDGHALNHGIFPMPGVRTILDALAASQREVAQLKEEDRLAEFECDQHSIGDSGEPLHDRIADYVACMEDAEKELEQRVKKAEQKAARLQSILNEFTRELDKAVEQTDEIVITQGLDHRIGELKQRAEKAEALLKLAIHGEQKQCDWKEQAEGKLRDKEEGWAIASASMGEAKGRAEADTKALQERINAILKKLCPYYSEENGDDPDYICWCCNSVRDILRGDKPK